MKKIIFILCVPLLFFSFSAYAVIVVNENHIRKVFDCKGDRVVIDGAGNEIVLNGECKEVAVDGDDNKVSITASLSIEVDGNDNAITWSTELNGKAPRVTTSGMRNTVERVAVGAVKQEQKQVTVASGGKEVSVSTSGSSDVEVKTNEGKSVKVQQQDSRHGKKDVTVSDGDKSVSVSTKGGSDVTVKTDDGKSVTVSDAQHMLEVATGGGSTAGSFMIADSDIEASYDCNGRRIMISGSNCRIELRGNCAAVLVSGDENKVHVESTGSIGVSGSNNKVTWANGKRPAISNTGEDNIVTQQE